MPENIQTTKSWIVKRMYSAWIKLDDSLPWIELEDAFQTKAEAQKAVEKVLNKAKIKISKLPKQEKRAKRQ
jgi:DNA-directed RNA polymerase subunit H (RpoH/RPB5)